MRIEEDEVASELVDGANLMRLAYVGVNGQPHVVPIWFVYENGEFVVVTGPKAEKARHLRENSRVAFTIDTSQPPYKALIGEGEASLEETEGFAPEYEQLARRYLGPAADAYLSNLRTRVKRQVRIAIRPTRWHVIDFVKRFPKSLS
jgi:PPOX class probable F420-dependent enzyme